MFIFHILSGTWILTFLFFVWLFPPCFPTFFLAWIPFQKIQHPSQNDSRVSSLLDLLPSHLAGLQSRRSLAVLTSGPLKTTEKAFLLSLLTWTIMSILQSLYSPLVGINQSLGNGLNTLHCLTIAVLVLSLHFQ